MSVHCTSSSDGQRTASMFTEAASLCSLVGIWIFDFDWLDLPAVVIVPVDMQHLLALHAEHAGDGVSPDHRWDKDPLHTPRERIPSGLAPVSSHVWLSWSANCGVVPHRFPGRQHHIRGQFLPWRMTDWWAGGRRLRGMARNFLGSTLLVERTNVMDECVVVGGV